MFELGTDIGKLLERGWAWAAERAALQRLPVEDLLRSFLGGDVAILDIESWMVSERDWRTGSLGLYCGTTFYDEIVSLWAIESLYSRQEAIIHRFADRGGDTRHLVIVDERFLTNPLAALTAARVMYRHSLLGIKVRWIPHSHYHLLLGRNGVNADEVKTVFNLDYQFSYFQMKRPPSAKANPCNTSFVRVEGKKPAMRISRIVLNLFENAPTIRSFLKEFRITERELDIPEIEKYVEQQRRLSGLARRLSEQSLRH